MTRPATSLTAIALAAVNLGFLVGLGRGLAEGVRQEYLEHGLGRLAVVALPRSLGAAILGCTFLFLGVALMARFVSADREAGPAWRRLALLGLGVALLLPICSRLAGPVLDDLYLASEEQPLWRVLSGAARLETTWAALLVVGAVGLRALASRWRPRAAPLAWARRSFAWLGAPRPALAAGLATLVLTGGVALDRRLAPPGGSNLVLIAIDTLRADHLGVYGYPRDVSPHIDALAADGVLFRHAQSPAPWTTPSLASVLSGRHPTRLGFADRPLRLPPDLLLLTELLRARNYRTHAIVSNLFASSAVGFEQGFDGFDEDNAQGHLHVSSASVTAKALAFLDRNARQPFFLYLHYFDPHYAYLLHPPDDYYPDYAGRLHDGMPIVELRALASQLREDDARYLRALYDSEIRFTDRHVGMVLDGLRQLGLYEEALIVFLADHGEEFLERGDHWIGHTRTLYEEQLRVPLILKLPGGRGAGTVVDARVGLVDVAPTVLALLGLGFPEGYALDGAALDPESASSRLVVAETRRWANLRAIYDDAWKLIRDLDSGRVELYRLDRDPGERVNLAASHPEPRQRLERALRAWEDTMASAAVPVDEGAFSPEEIEQLRSLGYVE